MRYGLRPYQERAVSGLINYIMNPDNAGKFPLLDLCVSAGKSVMIAETCKRLLNMFPNLSILNLVHTQELVEQNHERFTQVAPEVPASIYMGSLGKKDATGKVIFGSIQSVSKDIDLFQPNIIMVDECHWIQKKSAGMYRDFISQIQKKFPHVIVIGWTGTTWRMDGGSLVDGTEKLFDTVVESVKIRELLDLGFLSPLVVPDQEIRSKRTPTMKAETIHGNGFNVNLVSQIVGQSEEEDSEELIKETVEEYWSLAQGRKRHLIFGSRKKHCEQLKEAFSKYYKVEFIHGTMSKKKRREYIQMFRDGELDMLVSGIVLTTGFDVPEVDCIGLCRAVQSSALYVQIAGRGLRLAEGKANCLWLDFTETTEVHGPVDKLEAPPFVESDKKGQAVTKCCPVCSSSGEPFRVHPTVRFCPQCEYEFPMDLSAKHDSKAGDADVISKPVEWRDLRNLTWSRYTSQKDIRKQKQIEEKLAAGRVLTNEEANFYPKSYLKFTFNFGVALSVTKLVCFDSGNNGERMMACQFWSLIAQDQYKHQCPNHADHALIMLNDYKAAKIIKRMKFTYETHYNGARGKSKLSSPRLEKIIDVEYGYE